MDAYDSFISNGTEVIETKENDYTVELHVLLTCIYSIILVAGVFGNVSTCVVIARNRSMHTATNYYLFSLAVSDLLLLVFGVPHETYTIWHHDAYHLHEVICLLMGFISEMSANATVLTITAFTIERYIAICHPFISHTMTKLSRVMRFVGFIWLIAFCAAIPPAIQFGVATRSNGVYCTLTGDGKNAFTVSVFIFFVGPMTILTVLYALIGIKLRTSSVLRREKNFSTNSNSNERNGGLPSAYSSNKNIRNTASQRRVIRMLVAVTVSFFVCWAPFHTQRLMAVYGSKSATFSKIFDIVNNLSGVLYYLSTAINPLLYNLMSNKFRDAFRAQCCRRQRVPAATYRVISLQRNGTQYKPPRSRQNSTGSQMTAYTDIKAPMYRNNYTNRFKLIADNKSGSVDSGRSISNSSLRDLDNEYTGEELATYMEQINGVIDGDKNKTGIKIVKLR